MNTILPAVMVVYNLHPRDAGTISSLLAASGCRHALVSRREFAELAPRSVPRHLIVLGGPQTATDIADRETLALLRRMEFHARRGGAIFGICLGAQLLARAHGAKIVRHRSGAREIGYHRVRRLGPASSCDFPEGHYYQWHYDVIEDFSAGRVLMRSELAPVQAFRIGSNHFGLQFHPEVDLHDRSSARRPLCPPARRGRGAAGAGSARGPSPLCIGECGPAAGGAGAMVVRVRSAIALWAPATCASAAGRSRHAC